MKVQPGRYKVKSTTDARVHYTVVVKNAEEATCSCKGWIYHRKCKHVRAILAGNVTPAVLTVSA